MSKVPNPSHTVSIGVWDVHRRETALVQHWIRSGPFDSARDVADAVVAAMTSLVDSVELVSYKTSSEPARQGPPPWEQLAMFDNDPDRLPLAEP